MAVLSSAWSSLQRTLSGWRQALGLRTRIFCADINQSLAFLSLHIPQVLNKRQIYTYVFLNMEHYYLCRKVKSWIERNIDLLHLVINMQPKKLVCRSVKRFKTLAITWSQKSISQSCWSYKSVKVALIRCKNNTNLSTTKI